MGSASQKKYYKNNRSKIILRSKKWQKNNPDKCRVHKRQYNKDHDKERNQKIREQFLLMYGNKCNCCGEIFIEFLTIDHINGQKGTRIKKTGRLAYQIAMKEYRPDLYRILCYNCNNAIRFGGVCPHKKGER
jgi:hypothetical protein